jgi:hypothetical protein
LPNARRPKWGKALEWTSIVSSAEENSKILEGKPLFGGLYGIYTLTLNELKAVLKVNAQEGQCRAVTKTSLESAAHDDDFQEVKRHKRHISNDTSQTAKKSIICHRKLPTKTVITRNFFATLRTNDMDTETTGAENSLPEEEAPRKPIRSPPIVMTSTTNFIRLQSDLKEHVKGEYEFRITRNGTRIEPG